MDGSIESNTDVIAEFPANVNVLNGVLAALMGCFRAFWVVLREALLS
jgi:hypothetical protein